MNRLISISKKEFSDHITSRRFLLILFIICLVLGVAAANGVTNYNDALEKYKNENVGYLFFPSILLAFNQITNSIGHDGLGAVIGIAIGFDLVSGEKEGKSLKTILSQPVYRDELINGKAIGGIISLSIITLAGFLTVLAIFLIIGIVPSVDEFFLIGVIWLITLLFMISAFSLALMSSVLAKTSSGALIMSLIILFTLMYIIPVGGGEFGISVLLGPEPLDEEYDFGSQSQVESFENIQYEYNQKRTVLYDFFSLFSIQRVYNDITSPITMPSKYVISRIGFSEFSINPDIAEGIEKPSLWEILGDKWMKIIVFIMWPVLFFGIAYVRFMRMDLR
ncbi:ABC transporter permease [Methanogenium organophilum]|uniref:ABC transporter permease subunit n=1 Tax=Methanogenium organophilum TaxID=2199 RepID=A0A9X9T8F5_METOG|nr:ABC transporter permease subunit [Methanogenium organophilum]WAI01391.1 ABC transporter permease subunit [Methanogenium organophilum]